MISREEIIKGTCAQCITAHTCSMFAGNNKRGRTIVDCSLVDAFRRKWDPEYTGIHVPQPAPSTFPPDLQKLLDEVPT